MLIPGTLPAVPAAKLLRAQILTYHRTGHMIGMSEELPKRRICEAAKHGRLPRIYLRCTRCAAHAWLQDWLHGAELIDADRADRIAQLSVLGRLDRAGFLQPCTGQEYLKNMAILADQPADWGTE